MNAQVNPLVPLEEGLSRMPGTMFVGNLFAAWEDPIKLFTQATRAHGDDVRLKFLHIDYLLLNSPASVQHVLVGRPERYHKSQSYAGLKVVLGEGLLTSEGDFWKKQRRLAQPAFHRDRLAGFADVMVDSTVAMLDRWSQHEAKTGAPFDLHRELMRLTFRIVGLTLLSVDLDEDAKEVGDALNVALEWANQYVESVVRIPPWVPTPRNVRFMRAKKKLDALVSRIIEDRRQSGERKNDLLDMLMSAEDADTGERMSDAQIRHELLTLVLAGHETTANALSFAFYLLSRHPDVMRQVAAEVAVVCGDRPPALQDLRKLELTTMVVEESMRLYPPAWVFERQAVEDDVIGQVRIPKGTMIGISPFVAHRNARSWPNPEGFDPWRFSKQNGASRNRYTYLPFGGGQRFCIGNNFALMEMQIIIALVAQRFRIDLSPGFRLELDPSVTLRPKHGVDVVLRPAPPINLLEAPPHAEATRRDATASGT